MKLFDFLKSPDIHQGAAEQANTPGSLLLDVRTPEEFEQGHLPGSQNVPLDDLDKIAQVTDNRNTPLYVYCYSGARSRQAAAHGLYPRQKHRRHCRMERKDGEIA